MAGRMERKQYGLELYRAGIAQRLVLSVGRFEVSKMSRLELDGFRELVALRERTQPDERHFFTRVDLSGIHIERAKLQRWSTYGEALGLRQFLEAENVGLRRAPELGSSAISVQALPDRNAQVAGFKALARSIAGMQVQNDPCLGQLWRDG